MGKVKDFFSRMLRGKKRRPTQPPSQTGWYFNYGNPNPALRADGVSFDFTTSPYVEPHYFMHPHGALDASKNLIIKYRIDVLSGVPDFQSTQCTDRSPVGTGKAALFIRKNLNNSEHFNRAWADMKFRPLLVPGETTMSMPLSGVGWKFVYDLATGKPNEWANILANCTDIGITFGGCGHAGHGVYVKGGTARFTVLSVTVA
jgi:hypothetical protein